MVSRGLVLLLITFAVPAMAQLSPQQQELAVYVKQNYAKHEVMIPMRDGVKLFTAIYEPRNSSVKYPILITRTPYRAGPYGEDRFKSSLGPSDLFAKEGYIFVYQDVRGKWGSEGEFVDARPENLSQLASQTDESTDTFDTVDWLIRNLPNNNGRVGIYGISYPGFYTSAGIINSHPAIKAASPQAPVADWFMGDDWHHNGALFLAHAFNFYTTFGQPRPRSVTQPRRPFRHGTQDGYQYFLEMGSLANSSKRYEEQVGEIKFWKEMMQHPNYDDFWQARNILPKLKNIKCAVMTVGGWFDAEDLYGTLQTYQHIERQNPGAFNVLVMGPWFHAGWAVSSGRSLGNIDFGSNTAETFQKTFELPFFNYYLKGKGDISHIKEINIFETGSNEWKSYDQPIGDSWMPQQTREQMIYLGEGGRLTFNSPTRTGAATFDQYVSDPMKPVPYINGIDIDMTREYMTDDQRFAARRPDVVVYQTEPLTVDVAVIGEIRPTLYVSTSGTDSDFVVKLIDVFPDDAPVNPETKYPMGGYQMLVRGEPFRGRFRTGFARAIPMQPNKIEKIEFTMPGIAHRFKKGHRIMVQVQSSWFPLVDRNPQKFIPNVFAARESDFQKATQRIYHSRIYPSQLKLEVASGSPRD